MMRILAGAPLWVWPLLAALVAAGLAQLRARIVPRALVLAMPAVMTVLSVVGLLSSFGASAVALASWLVGAAVAVALNQQVWRLPRGVRAAAGGGYAVPGSIVPLLLMLAIFATRFGVGAVSASAPALATAPLFVALIAATLGLLSGLFVARAWRILPPCARRPSPRLDTEEGAAQIFTFKGE
jgi:hypothetical protein